MTNCSDYLGFSSYDDFVFLPTPDLETCYNQPLQIREGRKGLPCERVWYPYNCVVRTCNILEVEDMVVD